MSCWLGIVAAAVAGNIFGAAAAIALMRVEVKKWRSKAELYRYQAGQGKQG